MGQHCFHKHSGLPGCDASSSSTRWYSNLASKFEILFQRLRSHSLVLIRGPLDPFISIAFLCLPPFPNNSQTQQLSSFISWLSKFKSSSNIHSIYHLIETPFALHKSPSFLPFALSLSKLSFVHIPFFFLARFSKCNSLSFAPYSTTVLCLFVNVACFEPLFCHSPPPNVDKGQFRLKFLPRKRKVIYSRWEIGNTYIQMIEDPVAGNVQRTKDRKYHPFPCL